MFAGVETAQSSHSAEELYYKVVLRTLLKRTLLLPMLSCPLRKPQPGLLATVLCYWECFCMTHNARWGFQLPKMIKVKGSVS